MKKLKFIGKHLGKGFVEGIGISIMLYIVLTAILDSYDVCVGGIQ